MDNLQKLNAVREELLGMGSRIRDMRRFVEEVIEDYPVERSRSRLAEGPAASIPSSQLIAPASRFASQSVNLATTAHPEVVKVAKAAAWATTSVNTVKAVSKTIPVKVREEFRMTVIDLWPTDPVSALAESSVLIFQERGSYRENVSVKDNKIPINVKSLLSGRSLDQYATDNDDNDFVFLKISVLVPAGGRGKSLRGMQNVRQDDGVTEIINWPSSDNGGAILSFSQLQEEVSKKGSILYLRMSCCRPSEKSDADEEEETPSEGREEEGNREEVKVEESESSFFSEIRRYSKRNQKPIVNEDFVNSDTLSDIVGDFNFESFKAARTVPPQQTAAVKKRKTKF